MLINQTIQENQELLIVLNGEFDAAACEQAKVTFEALAQSHKDINVVMDLTDVTFIDSSGIGAIVFMYKRLLECQCTFHLCGVRGQPKELFEVLRINKAIPTSWHQAA